MNSKKNHVLINTFNKMKNLTQLLLIILSNYVMYAQPYTNIKPLGTGGIEQGDYFKDLDNVLDGFEGTYEYTGSDFYFKIKLEKKVLQNHGNYWWTDVLMGTYQYIKNGQEVNYLNDPLASVNTPARIQLDGIDDTPLFCPDCIPNQKYLWGNVSDRAVKKSVNLYMAKKIENGQEGLYLWMFRSVYGLKEGEYDPPIFLPEGEFFVKKLP